MKYDKKKAAVFDPKTSIPASRSYQLELLEESLRRNIIIALDTGSGKTHIAVLRIKAEVLERETRKAIMFPRSWWVVWLTPPVIVTVVIMVRCTYSSPRGTAERSHSDPYTRFRRISVRRVRSPSMEGPLIMAKNPRLPPCYDHHPTSTFGCSTTWVYQSWCRHFSAGLRRVSSYWEKSPLQCDYERVLPQYTTPRLSYSKRKLCSANGAGVDC